MWFTNLRVFVLCAIFQKGYAFPRGMMEAVVQAGDGEGPLADLLSEAFSKRQAGAPFYDPHPPFDAKLQYVTNKGEHAFIPPSGYDQRGPCAGLNAAANHGYLPHSGVATITDIVQGTRDAFGMAPDLGILLGIFGAVFDGDLTRYSIGGPYPGLTLGPLLGEPKGFTGSHNRYEGDGSPTRGDLYQYGNNYLSQMPLFQELYRRGMANGNKIDMPLLADYRAVRFQQSVSENPYFFNAAFSGILALPGAWSFIYRCMANHSAEAPEGITSLDTLKTFFSVTGDYPNFKYTPGWEKIPDNWYKRHPTDEYSIPYIVSDIVTMAKRHPEFATFGGNTGKPNSFVGVSLAKFTSGSYNNSSILEGNNLMCFALQASLQEAPDFLAGTFLDVNPAINLLGSVVSKATNSLGCPQLNQIDQSQLTQYPGYTRLKKDGTY